MGRSCLQCAALLRVVEMQAQALQAHQDLRARPQPFEGIAKAPFVAPAVPDVTPKLVSQAIDQRAGRDPHMKYHLGGVASDLLAAGFDETEVARRILDGERD